MEYQLMIPPFPIGAFEEMNKKEAQIHFDWYIKEIPNRIELLKEYYEFSGGGKKELLDFTPESLKNLWEWFIPRIRLERRSREEIESDLAKFPKLLKKDIMNNKYKISTESLAIAMDIAIYFAEVIIKHFQNIKWGFITKPKSYVSVNRPVLLGFKNNLDLDPCLILQTLCSKVKDGEKDPNILYETFIVWKKYEVLSSD